MLFHKIAAYGLFYLLPLLYQMEACVFLNIPVKFQVKIMFSLEVTFEKAINYCTWWYTTISSNFGLPIRIEFLLVSEDGPYFSQYSCEILGTTFV
jgi:hypothetical protein